MKPLQQSANQRTLPTDSGVAEMDQWLSHRTFWFVACVVAVVLLPFTIAWVLQKAWVIAFVTGSGFVAIAVCGWLVRRRVALDVNPFIWAILSAEFVGMGVVSWLQGGDQAPALRWMAIIPFIAIASGAFRLGVTMSVLFIVQVLVMHGYHPDYLLAYRPHVLPSPDSQKLLAVIVPVALFTFFGWFTTKWRRRILDALDEARQAALQGELARERFLATISHEIRTPLNGIVGTLSLLRSGHLAPEHQAQLFDRMSQSSSSLLTMLNDVLDWSKLDGGHMRVHLQPVDLRDLMEESVELFAVSASAKGLELTCAHDPGVATAVLSDGPRLRQILHNLVANAVKFTAAGDVHVQLTQAGDVDGRLTLTLAVSDTGIGMDEAQVARLFRPFEQGDQSITREYGGTGLGLAISQELAQLLAGDIRVSSKPGVGSTFALTWAATRDTDQPHVAPVDVPGRTLLFLTHHAHLIDHLKSCASALGHTLLVPSQPRDAMGDDSWRDLGVDAVLVDARFEPDAGMLARLQSMKVAVLADVSRVASDAWPVVWPRLPKPLTRRQLQQWLNASPQPTPDLHQAPSSLGVQGQNRQAGLAVVADDNALNQVILKEMLELLGWQVQVVTTGGAAVQACSAQEVDVLLIDYQMPQMDGLSAVRMIREAEGSQPSTRHLPVVLVSGDATLRSVDEWRQSGVDHVLGKPLDFDELARLMSQIKSRLAQ